MESSAGPSPTPSTGSTPATPAAPGGARAEIVESIDLDVPIERAWPLVSDFDALARWIPLHESFPQGAPNRDDIEVGTVVHERIKFMGIPAEVVWTVCEWDPPTAVGMDGTGPMGTWMKVRVKTEPSEGGVRVTHASEFGGAALAPMIGVVEREARKAAAESVGRMRAAIEQTGEEQA